MPHPTIYFNLSRKNTPGKYQGNITLVNRKKFFFGAKNLKTDFSYIWYAEFKYEISFFLAALLF